MKNIVDMNNGILINLIFVFFSIIVGCSDTDFYEKKYDDKIAFFAECKTEALTRGTPIELSNNIPNISVYGYYTGDGNNNTWEKQGANAVPDFFDGITITNSGVGTEQPSWNYSDHIFWPSSSDANVSFFAYSPALSDNNGITVINKTGTPTLHYSTPVITVNQPDLMIAVPQYDLNYRSDSPILFSMKHALTCLSFQGAGDNKVVKSISLSGISLEGDLNIDGSDVNWSNLSPPEETTIEVGLDNDSLKLSMSTDLTASDGYLMLIPQTLTENAKLTVKIENEEDLVYNMSNQIWKAGERVNFSLVIGNPEGEITVSPSDLTISALGTNTDSLTITCTPSYGTWTLTSPESWIKFSLNKDGSDASSTVSGMGNDKVYVIVDPYIMNKSQNRSAAIYADNETSDIKVNITQTSMMNIPSTKKGYAGAFWRCAQKGERLIRIPCDIGDWKAFVFWMDDQWEQGDIILDGNSFTWPADLVNVGEDTPEVSGSATSISGNTDSGIIGFRIGLKSTYNASNENPARYALLAITWNNGNDVQFLFIRQGEDPDYIMRPTDIYGDEQAWASGPIWRPEANKVSMFNLTAETLDMQCSRERDSENPSRFTDYPSQVGAFFQWANDVNVRYAYSPMKNASPWNYSWPTGYWSELASTNESSPVDYPLTYGGTVNFRRMTNGIITGPATPDVKSSEAAQSLYYTPYSSVDNMIYAYLADGYFDRMEYSDNNGVNINTEEAAYWGQLIYNPISKASIFVPYSGYISGRAGEYVSAGVYINMWTSTSENTSTAIIWNFNNQNGGGMYNNARAAGFTIRPVVDSN